MALAHALEASGALDEARTVLEPLLTPAGLRAFEEDGWWMYPRGQYSSGMALLETLRARVMRPE